MPLRSAWARGAMPAGRRPAAALLELGELPLDPVEVQVDLPLVVPAEAHAEDDVVHLLRADRGAHLLTRQRGLDTVEELVDLVDLVAAPQRAPPETLSLTRHYVSHSVRWDSPSHCATSASAAGPCVRLRHSLAASWPHAPSISRPRVSRTVVATPASRSRRTNSRSTGLGLASHLLPGVGLSGMRFTWASLPCSSRPSRSARQG